jgi:N-acetylmuramoyl-L-alanine amidase
MLVDKMIDHRSPNHGARDAAVDMLVLHYTGMKNAAAALERLCDPAAKVSAHYLIDEDGAVLALVDETRRAWHAGVSQWRGHTDINDRSVGIELVNPGHEHGYRRFPEPQMAALIVLSRGIVARHAIAARNVVGHGDIAPDRKSDPGELFDWRRLADAGIGLWPDQIESRIEQIPALLRRFGYDTVGTGALAAFQRHFRPARIDGAGDQECARLLAGLMALID